MGGKHTGSSSNNLSQDNYGVQGKLQTDFNFPLTSLQSAQQKQGGKYRNASYRKEEKWI